jgi:predicted nucleic acid-binding protein
MPTDRVVVNASPLIVLFRSGQADLLPRLFHDILVPAPVWQEVTESAHQDLAAAGLCQAKWAKIVSVQDISPLIAAWDLGPGESSVLTFALHEPDCRVMVDDRAARRCAKAIGVRSLGTAGMLVLAKRRGVIPSVADGIAKLREAGLWLTDDLVETWLREAGETG